jgi:hypothetical protein
MQHTVGKISTKVIILLHNSPQSKVCTKSYTPLKLQECEFQEFRDSQLGSPETKWHLDVGPMAKHKEYYKGEGGGFPQIWAMVSFVSPCLFVHQKCSNLQHALINLLFSLCDVLPSPLLDPNWIQKNHIVKLFGIWGTLLASSTKRGRRACWSFGIRLGGGTSFT